MYKQQLVYMYSYARFWYRAQADTVADQAIDRYT